MALRKSGSSLRFWVVLTAFRLFCTVCERFFSFWSDFHSFRGWRIHSYILEYSEINTAWCFWTYLYCTVGLIFLKRRCFLITLSLFSFHIMVFRRVLILNTYESIKEAFVKQSALVSDRPKQWSFTYVNENHRNIGKCMMSTIVLPIAASHFLFANKVLNTVWWVHDISEVDSLHWLSALSAAYTCTL